MRLGAVGSSRERERRIGEGREYKGWQLHLRTIWRAVWKQHSTSFLKYKHEGYLNKTSNNWGNRTPTGHILSLHEDSSTGNGSHLIRLLAKGVPWEDPNNADCCRDYGLLSTNWRMVLLLMTRPTWITEHGDIELVPTLSLHPYWWVLKVLEDNLHITKGEDKHKPSCKPSDLQCCPPCRIFQDKGGTKLVE